MKRGNPVPVPPPTPFKTRWSRALPTATRVVLAAGSSLFFVGLDAGPLEAYSLVDGRPIWTADLNPDVPIVTGDDLVFVSQGSSVHALEQATGKIRWTAEAGALAVAPTWQPGWLFTSAKDGSLAAWRTSDGSRVWQQALGSPGSAPIVVHGDRIFAGLADRRLVGLGLLPDGQVLWSVALDGVAGEILAAADRLYFGTSDYGFFCVNQDNGKLDWPPHRVVHSTVIGRPAIDDDYIWIATLNNSVLALSRGNGEIVFMNTLPSRPAPQLVIDHSQVIVPLESGALALFDRRDGKAVRPPAPAPGGAAPAPPPPPAAGSTASPRSPLVPPSSGARIAAPLVAAGSAEAPAFLRVTLAADGVYTVTAFERWGTSCVVPFLPCQFFRNLLTPSDVGRRAG